MAKQSKKDFIKSVLRAVRIGDSLEAKGVNFKHAEKKRYTNVRWIYRGYGAELGDATVHTSYRYEVSGRTTYHLRDLLKANGFRWDPREKVWHAKESPENFSETILRTIAERALA